VPAAEEAGMNERLAWWVLPGAMLVLLRVVTLGEPETTPPVVAVDASAHGGSTAVLEASGRRLGDIVLPVGEAGAFMLSVPARHVGVRGDMTLWRRTPQGREASPWLRLRPRVRSDATIPMSGLAAGRYDIELRFGEVVLVAENVVAPGTVVLQPLAPLPPR
jgi:hypothetical protein